LFLAVMWFTSFMDSIGGTRSARGGACGMGGREDGEISNFRFEISNDGEEGSFGRFRPQLNAFVVGNCGRWRARRLLCNRIAIDRRPYEPKIAA
jgi:hypothetical protein